MKEQKSLHILVYYFLDLDEKQRSYGVKHGKILPKNQFFQHGCDTPQKKSVDRNQNLVSNIIITLRSLFIHGGNKIRPGWHCGKHR